MASSADMLAMLRRHYLPEGRPPAGLFAEEIASPCGSRRADLIWVPTTSMAAHGARIIGHEVKVTRSDVLTELADPAKHDPWSRYCDRWWLVVSDPEIVKGLDIPDGWGVMAPPSGRRTRTMTVLRPAPKLSPENAGPALSRISAFVVNRVEERVRAAERDVEWRTREVDRLRRQVGELQLMGGRGRSPHEERLARIASAVQARVVDERLWGLSDEELDAAVVEAAVDLISARDAAVSTINAVDMARRQVADASTRSDTSAGASRRPAPGWRHRLG